MSRQERQRRRLQRHYEQRDRASSRREAVDQNHVERQALARDAWVAEARQAWRADIDMTRVPPYSEMEYLEEIRPVVIVGLPGPWYLAKRIIGVYLVLLAITVGVAIVFALAVASCGALTG